MKLSNAYIGYVEGLLGFQERFLMNRNVHRQKDATIDALSPRRPLLKAIGLLEDQQKQIQLNPKPPADFPLIDLPEVKWYRRFIKQIRPKQLFAKGNSHTPSN